MKRGDEYLVERWRSELDADLDNIDDVTTARLAQIRRNALSRPVARQSFIPRMAPAIAFAASAIVLAIFLRVPDGPISQLDPDVVLMEIVLAEGELELIEDLEFYRWLDANGNAG